MSSRYRYSKNEDDRNRKLKLVNPIWRPITSQANSYKESSSKVENSAPGQSSVSKEKHSVSIKVGASLIGLVKGKGGATQKKIEEQTGATIVFSSSRKEDSVTVEGVSADSVAKASAMIQTIINQAVKSPSLDFSHFISLPLAINHELVDKLFMFQNSILGCGGETSLQANVDGQQKFDKRPNDIVKDKADGNNEEDVKVNITSITPVSYAPNTSKSSAQSKQLAELGIEESIFINPKTFHLTVLMLKLWNNERVDEASEVLRSISSRVIDALDNRPISIRLQGLDCMKGSAEKARVVYIPVEEIGSEGRLLNACQIIIDAFVEAGLVLEKDANHSLKLHATVMNARHRKRSKGTRVKDSFDARSIFEQYGSKDWGEYRICEAHLSQRFKYDDEGYYHCCASIPLPSNIQQE